MLRASALNSDDTPGLGRVLPSFSTETDTSVLPRALSGTRTTVESADPRLRDGGAWLGPAPATVSAQPAEDVGLSKAHILPQAEAITGIARGGRLWKGGLMRERLCRGCGKRERITGFSRASRRRMIERFNALDRSKVLFPPLFVTLTLPGGPPEHWVPYAKDMERHLEAFLKRFYRFHKWGFGPNVFVMWRKEPQKRGAPHLHLLIFNVPYVPADVVGRWWWEVVGSGDEEHLKAGVRVEGCHTWTRAAYYLSKYLCKDDSAVVHESYRAAYTPEELALVLQLWESPGRFWGIRRREHMPVTIDAWAMSKTAFYRLRRIARGLAKAQTLGRYRMRAQDTFTVFGNSCDGGRALAFVGAWRI